tara:strand:+ start:276 stop:788 length:513 start_codon:yes stop_codon:yes gene_type:complete
MAVRKGYAMLSRIRPLLVACAALFVFGAMPARAGDVILTIDGNVTGNAPVDMTIDDIEALGSATIVTKTPWHDTSVSFTGVRLSSLLEKTGAKGKTLSVAALNNYRSEIPVSDIGEHGVILAYKQDGEYMPVSDKGPLFVVYPFDAEPELNTEVYYTRSAWQVRSITVDD